MNKFKFHKYNPWSNLGNHRDLITLIPKRSLVALIIVAGFSVGLLVSAALPVSGIFDTIVTSILVISFCGIGTVAVFYIKSYNFETIKTADLQAGYIFVTDYGGGWLGSGYIIGETFEHYGDGELRIGLLNGEWRSLSLDGQSQVARPSDLFEAVRPISLPHRFPPEPPSDEVLQILLSIWDQVQIESVFEPPASRVKEYISNQFTSETLALDDKIYEHTLLDAIRQRLVYRKAKGLGAQRTEYLSLTGYGTVVVASFLRNNDIEPYERSDKEKPIIVGNNFGNIFRDSPGAAGVVGSGSAVGGSENSIRDSLQHLTQEKQSIVEQIADVETRQAVSNAVDDIEHELEHPTPDDERLKSHVRTVSRLAGTVAISVVGSATWSLLTQWIT